MEVNNQYSTKDDFDFIEMMNNREDEYILETKNDIDELSQIINGFENKTRIELEKKKYVKRKTVIENTDKEIAEEIKKEFKMKIEFEKKREEIIEEEINKINQRINEYKSECEKKKMLIEKEQNQQQENISLLSQFGIEIDVVKESNKTLLIIDFEKMRKYDNGYLELKISGGVIRVNKCSPDVKEIDRLLDQFYQHHNFMIFLLQVRNCFKTN